MRPDPAVFKLWQGVDVRFKDIDFGGHAHHSVALSYFEEARCRYWKEVAGRADPQEVDFILAEVRVRYHARILYPLRLQVGVRVSALGRKHFAMEYLATDPDGEPLVSGETTMVMFDYQEKKSKRIPDEIRAAIEAHEGPLLEG